MTNAADLVVTTFGGKTFREEWLAVVGYEGLYEVSSEGRVRGLIRGRVLSLYAGDHYVKVRLKRDGEGRTFNVHSLVAAAFHGPRPDGMEVCHNNGDPHDNRAENLRYDTHVANSLERAPHGVCHYGSRTHCNKGHAYTPENTYVRPCGARTCRTCDKARRRAS